MKEKVTILDVSLHPVSRSGGFTTCIGNVVYEDSSNTNIVGLEMKLEAEEHRDYFFEVRDCKADALYVLVNKGGKFLELSGKVIFGSGYYLNCENVRQIP